MANEVTLNFTAEQIDVRLENAGNAILHTEQTLTPEQQAQARANMNAADAEVVGNIEAALEAIIAIQNELIGGDSA
jgi:hypothetical protein